jgi:aldehyde dehydrogenase (NAD+)
MSKLTDRVKTLKVGDPMDKATRMGPVVSKSQMETVLSYIESGKREGAQVVAGGGRAQVGNGKGFFVEPTIFDGVTNTMTIAREEIFGPVLSVLTFRTPTEAIEKANNTPYGLSAGVWTDKGSRILWMAQKLRAGVVWANTFNRFDPTSPFGGYKESGYGREGGRHGLGAYLDV